MSLGIDLRNAVQNSGNNFSCELIKLFFKADYSNFAKLAQVFPDEAQIVWLYQHDCSYKTEANNIVDYVELERRAMKMESLVI